MEKQEIREQKLDANPISSAQYQVPSSLPPHKREKKGKKKKKSRENPYCFWQAYGLLNSPVTFPTEMK